jgi:hypothetical protein
MRTILFFGAALALACQNDAPNGELRLTTASPFAEIDDLEAPFAVGRIVPVFLADDGSGDPLSNLTIEIEPQDTAQIIPLGSATFGVVLEAPGSYTLSVLEDGSVIDSASITAEEIASLRVSKEATIRNIKNAGTEEECSSTDEKNRFKLDKFTLHQNQELELSIVAQNANGEPLLGLLGLSLDTEAPVSLNASNLSGINAANTFTIAPAGTLGAPITVNTEENPSGQVLAITIETSSDDESFICF